MDVLKIIELSLTLIILPTLFMLIKMHNKITILEIRLENKKEMFDIIFKKLEENREDLHEVNLKTEKILSKLEKD
jgi:CII-binding regulator of phage lambda lysogenization HflD